MSWETAEEQEASVKWAMAVMKATAEAGFPCYVALQDEDDEGSGASYWWCEVDVLRGENDTEYGTRAWDVFHKAIVVCESLRPPCVKLSVQATAWVGRTQ